MKRIEPINQPEILLVDDTPEHIETAVTLLRQNNYRIRIATRGSAALRLMDRRCPDLVLLDVYMPEMDGFEVCRLLKGNEAFRDIPIIFLTSSNDEESIKRGFSLGAQDYVVKPFNVSELLARVNTHIKLKRQTQSLKEANLELDSFCYTVAHDLKAPLLSISKLAEYLEGDYSTELGSDGQELIANIREKSVEVVNIVNHLLEFSRMCEMQMHSEYINMNELFKDAYKELMQQEPERQVDFFMDGLPQIKGDAVMLKLLCLNILSNALKYTRHTHSPSIQVSCSESESEYIFSVRDNGAGFDMRYSSRLFGVFQRLHSKNEFEGSGVGLAISQRILKRHNGVAWMTGEVNNGATFFFSLPK
ncbi:histidine kinase/DNA gyrase B/HSP90-like ATPase [Anaerobacterium chartisolvens]|uniref:Stage 0 sporulation protein A homolog n=1 Tax=Anaerobacterium chartisolvens TaxID=1297424 RepID=A0A369AZC3_9FIRM|nr:response regulator [Anaerobacterium chartisolvens]RCX13537.1 histidine kinase/DNA gyrase B/HSP90-like ATPase [Anaerobacterium chartisolvens]